MTSNEMKTKLIHGIDLSLTGTALVSVFPESGDISQQESQIGYSLKRGAPWWQRTRRVRDIVDALEERLAFKDAHSMILFEGPALGARGPTMFNIGEMMNEFQRRVVDWPSREIVEVNPSTLKKFVTGKGNANKELIAAHVTKRWDHIFSDNNLTDAFGLCQIGRALLGHLEMPKVHMTSLQKVLRHVQVPRTSPA
jgi:hypothetical protein